MHAQGQPNVTEYIVMSIPWHPATRGMIYDNCIRTPAAIRRAEAESIEALCRAQMVQRLEGRPDRNAPGDGHCDAVLAVDAHPKLSVIASGALEKDCTVKLWADSTDPSVAARMFGMFDAANGNAAIGNAAADAAAAASAQPPPAAATAAPEQACTQPTHSMHP